MSASDGKRTSPLTEKTWPDEDRDTVLARVRTEHGDAVAEVVAHDWETRVKIDPKNGTRPKGYAKPSKVGRYRRLKRSTRR